jgi:C4-dicarboxylate-binding protein DctP
MRISHLLRVVTVGIFCAAFFLTGSANSFAKEKYQFMAQSVYPGPDVSNGSKCFLEWMNRVEKATDGQVTFKKFYGHQLVGIKESLAALQKGTLDLLYAASYWTGTIPESDFQWLPFHSKGTEHSIHLFRQTQAGVLYEEAYREHGAEILSYIPVSIESLMCKKPVYNVGDYKGLKLRSGSTIWNKMLKDMGATPVMMSGAEQYTALQRGVLDGTIYPIYTIETYKFHEVTDYLIMPGIVDPMQTIVWMNLDKWRKLSPRLRTIINQVSIQFEQEYMIPNDEEVTGGVMDACKKYGVEVIRWKKKDFEELKEIGLSVWNDFSAINARCKEMVEIMAADQEWWVKNKGPQYKEWEERWLAKD